MDIPIWEALIQLGSTGLLAGILVLYMKQQAEAAKQRDEDHKATANVLLDVIRENTGMMGKVEKAINGLPEFVRQVDRRLQNGKQVFGDHARRLEKLEQEDGNSSD